MHTTSVRPFVPSKDFELSKAFYAAIGFHVENAGDKLAVCSLGSATFFLQDYYLKVFAENLMMQLIVEDIEDAHSVLLSAPIDKLKYPTAKLNPIKLNPIKYSPIKEEAWGKVVYLWGPAGELWHITELKQPE